LAHALVSPSFGHKPKVRVVTYWARVKRQKQGPMGQFKRRKYKLRNHKTLEVVQLRRRKKSQRYHKTLKDGVKKKNN
jgi:hypothetical protein